MSVTAWASDELDKIGAAEELHLSSVRRDGTLRRPVTMWVVRAAAGGLIEVICPGDRVFFEPGEQHWHGAAPTRFMSQLAMLEVDDKGNSATWGDHVSDEEYADTPRIDIGQPM
jgi:hypothetical protein